MPFLSPNEEGSGVLLVREPTLSLFIETPPLIAHKALLLVNYTSCDPYVTSGNEMAQTFVGPIHNNSFHILIIG